MDNSKHNKIFDWIHGKGSAQSNLEALDQLCETPLSPETEQTLHDYWKTIPENGDALRSRAAFDSFCRRVGLSDSIGRRIVWGRRVRNLAAALFLPVALFSLLLWLNPRQAFVWDMQAAKAGSAEGMRNVGDYYREGNGQEEDHVEAAKWYLRAARLGDVSSYVRLAKLFSEGDGVRKDAAAAYVLYNAAAHPPKGVSPDRNAAAGARNVKKFMKADDLARAEKLTLAEIFESLKAIDKEPVRTK